MVHYATAGGADGRSEYVNDLDPRRWKEYEEGGLKFFSIWDTPARDPLRWTAASIHGACPLEIPRQCIWRFSRKGDTVLDPFVGSGTTIAVCVRLRRRGIGIELNPNIAAIARKNFRTESSGGEVDEWSRQQRLIIGDSRNLRILGIEDESIHLVFSHPPYWNLIKYGSEYGEVPRDLSNEETLQGYLIGMEMNFREILRVLRPRRYFCLLIGDTFTKEGKTIPLAYYLTELALKLGFEYHSEAIKYTRLATSRLDNMDTTKFLSLSRNFLICIHDHVLIFRKN